MKIIVYVLGYEPKAEQNGGYPVGYATVAAQEGITKGINPCSVAVFLVSSSSYALSIRSGCSSSDEIDFIGTREWYVVRGTYRLQLTHKAINSNGSVAETVVKYGDTVKY